MSKVVPPVGPTLAADSGIPPGAPGGEPHLAFGYSCAAARRVAGLSIALVQIKPRKHVLRNPDHAAPTGQHDLRAIQIM